MSTDCLLTRTIKTASGQSFAWLELNRPDKLNVLNLELIVRLEETFTAYLADPDIAAIFLSGCGTRGFCAGGDVVEVVRTAAAHPQNPTITAPFFTHEYRLDQMIHRAAKPVIVLGHGIVMGGGIGLYAGASHRILTPDSVLAMPEISIGLFPDVGGSFFLTRMPDRIGRFLGLTAARMNAADAFHIGFADLYLTDPDPARLVAALATARFSSDLEHNRAEVDRILATLTSPPPDPVEHSRLARFRPLIDTLSQEPDIHSFAHHLNSQASDDPWLESCRQQFNQGSPFSLHVIDEQLRRGASLTLEQAFAMERIMAVNMTRHREFTTGVTARLIERNPTPDWQWKTLADVPRGAVLQIFVDPFDAVEEK